MFYNIHFTQLTGPTTKDKTNSVILFNDSRMSAPQSLKKRLCNHMIL